MLDAQIQRILELGVELRCNCVVGRDILVDELRREYQAVFVGIGAQKGVKLKALNLELGNGCRKCADACPWGYIEMN